MRVLLFLFYVLFATLLYGQAPVDSLAIVKQVDSLFQLSNSLSGKGNFSQALEIIQEAEKIILNSFDKQSTIYSTYIYNLGRISFNKNEFSSSEKCFEEALKIRGVNLGKEHALYAQALAMLGQSQLESTQYENAEANLLECLAIRKKLFGAEDKSCITPLVNLGSLYIKIGRYEKAEKMLLESKNIHEMKLGKDIRSYFATVLNLGSLYNDLDDFESAEAYNIEAITWQKNKSGEKDPAYAMSLMNLANLYKITELQKAEQIYLEALGILEHTLGKEHQIYALALQNLALVYQRKGDNEKSFHMELEALEIYKKTVGEDHPDYGLTLSNTASLYEALGDFDKAEELTRNALSIFEKKTGEDSPLYLMCLNRLANIYQVKGNKEAEQLFLQIKLISANSFGRRDPNYKLSLEGLVRIYEAENRLSDAEPLLLELGDLNQSKILEASKYFSEWELAKYIVEFNNWKNQLSNAIFFRHLQKQPSNALINLLFDNTLFEKGFLLNATQKANKLTHATPESKELNNRLKGYNRLLAKEYVKPITDQINVAELESNVAATEKELARLISGYADATHQIKYTDIQSSLKPGESVIEFVNFNIISPKKPDSVLYAALVLLPGGPPPNFIPLAEEKALNTLLSSAGARKSDYVDRVYSFEKAVGKSLYEMIWKPIEKELTGVKTVYFAPSGLLHRINLGAIPITKKECMTDRFHLIELGSTRSLAEGTKERQLVISPESNRSAPDTGQAMLFGGVQYDLNSDSIASQNIEIESSITGTRGNLNFSYTDSTDRGGSWNYLKWTDKEVTALEPILKSAHIQTTIRKGYAATEEAFKSIGSNGKSPRILHIATHGYFFPDPVQVRKTEFGIRNDAEPVFKMSDHPMIRSGLILAGGNHAWKTGKPFKEGMEDGILTAYEISQMDLSNTELVVLSACETGLGDIQGNEGVYGLQRAFKIAGAKYLIMSLWQVPDFQTQELMTTFYTNWLTKKMTIPDAFRAAQQTMREKYEHPYFWAGFVLVE